MLNGLRIGTGIGEKNGTFPATDCASDVDASFPLAALQGDVQGIIALYYSRSPGRPDILDG